MRPIKTKFLAWEIWLFEVTRGPWVLLGVLSAVLDGLLKRESTFRITSKEKRLKGFQTAFLLPYIGLASFATLIVVTISTRVEAEGYYLLLLLSATALTISTAAVVLLSKKETNTRWRNLRKPIGVATLMTLIVCSGWVKRNHEVLATLSPSGREEIVR